MDSYWSDCINKYDFATARSVEAELWSVPDVATGSLYNVGNSCMMDAAERAWDSLTNMVSSDEVADAAADVDAEAVKDAADAAKDADETVKETFNRWNYSDGYMMVVDATWPVDAAWKKPFEFGFCVSAAEGDANCFGQDFLFNQGYSLGGAYSSVISDSKTYTGQGPNFSSWPLITDGREKGLGLWNPTFKLGAPAAAEPTAFTVDGYWFQPTEGNTKKNDFRFSPGAVKVSVLNGSIANGEWASTDFVLTGAASLAAAASALATVLTL